MQNVGMSTINLKYTLFIATYEMGPCSLDVLPELKKNHTTTHADNRLSHTTDSQQPFKNNGSIEDTKKIHLSILNIWLKYIQSTNLLP